MRPCFSIRGKSWQQSFEGGVCCAWTAAIGVLIGLAAAAGLQPQKLLKHALHIDENALARTSPLAASTVVTLLLLLQVPVGRGTLGRIMNVIGEPVDECGPIGEMLARLLLVFRHVPCARTACAMCQDI